MNRVWIYAADRNLTKAEHEKISGILDAFVGKWAAHNNKLYASYEIRYDRFIILSVQEDIIQASGCSIDESTRFIRQLGQDLGVDFFDRQNMIFMDGEIVNSCTLNEIGKFLEAGKLTAETEVFDCTITDSEQLKKIWKLPLRESRYAAFA